MRPFLRLGYVCVLAMLAWVVQGASDNAEPTPPAVESEASRPYIEASQPYIVVLDDAAVGGRGASSRAREVAEKIASRHGGQVGSVFQHAINAFTIELPESALSRLRAEPGVQYTERDVKAEAKATQRQPPSWGLARVNHRTPDRTAPYVYSRTGGKGITVFVLDTGIQTTHSDFRGRASMGASFVKGEVATDLNGHGTHVAGTIGSATYGVARGVSLVGVKVLDEKGEGFTSQLIAGLDYAAQHLTPLKTVVNISVGVGKSQAVNDAVDNLFRAGGVIVAAAGNEAGDACCTSPPSATGAFAVAASDSDDAFWRFTNTGRCVKLFAPGGNIKSLWKGEDGATSILSGTSMAAPHVSGIAALYMTRKSYRTSAEVYDDLVRSASPGVDLRPRSPEVPIPRWGTPSRLAFTGLEPVQEDRPLESGAAADTAREPDPGVICQPSPTPVGRAPRAAFPIGM